MALGSVRTGLRGVALRFAQPLNPCHRRRSTGMATPFSKSANTNTKPAPEPTKPPATVQAEPDTQPTEPVTTEPVTTEPRAAPAAVNETTKLAEKTIGKTILSLAVTDKFARNCRMLSKLSGRSMTDLVVSLVEDQIKVQLRAALAELREDVE